MFCTSTRLCARADDAKIVRSRDAQCNTEELPKKWKTCTVLLSSYTNTSGSLGEREMLWEHEPQASVSTAFSSSPKLSRVFVFNK